MKNFIKPKVIAIEIFLYLWSFLDFWYKISGMLDVIWKNGFDILVKQEKSFQISYFTFFGLEKGKKSRLALYAPLHMIIIFFWSFLFEGRNVSKAWKCTWGWKVSLEKYFPIFKTRNLLVNFNINTTYK